MLPAAEYQMNGNGSGGGGGGRGWEMNGCCTGKLHERGTGMAH